MSKWLFLSRERTKTVLSRAEIFDGHEEYEEIPQDSESLEWEYVSKNWMWKHHVSVFSNPPEYEVAEETYVSWIWFAANFGSFLVLVVAEGILTGLLAAFLFFGLLGFLFSHRTPLNEFWRRSDSNGEEVIAMVMLLSLLFPIIFIKFLFSPSDVVFFVFSVAAYGGYWIGESYFIRFSEWWQSWVTDWMEDIPYVLGDYAAMLFLVSIPMLVFRYLWNKPLFLRSLFSSRLILLAYSLVFSVIWLGMIWRIHVQSFGYTQVSYSSEGQKQGRVRNLALAVVAVGISLLFGGLAWWFAQRVVLLASVDVVVGVAVALSTGWPVLLVASGLLYQEFGLWRRVLKWYIYDRNEGELCPGIEIEPDIRVVSSELPVAGAVSVGFYEFLVISDTLVEQLSERELEVVLAHEEGHIRHGDARLAFLIAVFSPLLLTGKNVLFSAARFERREIRADRHAVQKVGSLEQVTEALEAMNRLSQDFQVRSIPGATPTTVSFGQNSLTPESVIEQVFGFFYGDFAVTKAHPSFEDRIAALNS